MQTNTDDKKLTKEDHLVNFIKEFRAVEEAMEPFKDHKRDLRTSYSENNWLSKEEMRLAVRAYRLIKSEADFDQLTEYFEKLSRTFRGAPNV